MLDWIKVIVSVENIGSLGEFGYILLFALILLFFDFFKAIVGGLFIGGIEAFAQTAGVGVVFLSPFSDDAIVCVKEIVFAQR